MLKVFCQTKDNEPITIVSNLYHPILFFPGIALLLQKTTIVELKVQSAELQIK